MNDAIPKYPKDILKWRDYGNDQEKINDMIMFNHPIHECGKLRSQINIFNLDCKGPLHSSKTTSTDIVLTKNKSRIQGITEPIEYPLEFVCSKNCEFRICELCFLYYKLEDLTVENKSILDPKSFQSITHPEHLLYKKVNADYDNKGWQCDECKLLYCGLKKGGKIEYYSCDQCKFDICDTCVIWEKENYSWLNSIKKYKPRPIKQKAKKNTNKKGNKKNNISSDYSSFSLSFLDDEIDQINNYIDDDEDNVSNYSLEDDNLLDSLNSYGSNGSNENNCEYYDKHTLGSGKQTSNNKSNKKNNNYTEPYKKNKNNDTNDYYEEKEEKLSNLNSNKRKDEFKNEQYINNEFKKPSFSSLQISCLLSFFLDNLVS